jgi:hypothetical protein
MREAAFFMPARILGFGFAVHRSRGGDDVERVVGEDLGRA